MQRLFNRGGNRRVGRACLPPGFEGRRRKVAHVQAHAIIQTAAPLADIIAGDGRIGRRPESSVSGPTRHNSELQFFVSRVEVNTKDTKDTKMKTIGFPLCPSCPLCLLDVGIS